VGAPRTGQFLGISGSVVSLAASIFDMAIYPTLFVFYLKQFSPWFGTPSHGILAGLFVVVSCAVAELVGIPRGGDHVAVVVLLPVGAVRGGRGACAVQGGDAGDAHAAPAVSGNRAGRGVLVAMWNYMGWTMLPRSRRKWNARNEHTQGDDRGRWVLVSLTYVLPFLAVYFTGVPASTFAEDGSPAWCQATPGPNG